MKLAEHPLFALATDSRRLSHPDLDRPYTESDVLVILASTAKHRLDAVVKAAESVGISRHPIATNGVDVEKGPTPHHCAAEKVDAVAARLMLDGYFDRNPDRLHMIIGIDVLNTDGTQYYGKPAHVDQFASFAEHWERAALGEVRIVSESSYILVAACRGRVQHYAITDRVGLDPKNRRIVQMAFQPPELRIADAANIAHGFPTAWGIRHGELCVTDLRGNQRVGDEAVDRAIGASPEHATLLLGQALRDFSSYIRW